MKTGTRFLLPLLMACCASPPGQAVSASPDDPDTTAAITAGAWNLHLNYVGGYKQLEEGWSPARHQVEFGLVDVDFGRNDWPANICAQLLLSYSPVVPRVQGIQGDFSGTFEFNVGVRKVFRPGERIQPHAGAGIGILGAGTTTRLHDFGYYQETNVSHVGYWANAGFFWMFSDNYHTGLALEYSSASVTLFDERIGVGGIHVLLYFGWHR